VGELRGCTICNRSSASAESVQDGGCLAWSNEGEGAEGFWTQLWRWHGLRLSVRASVDGHRTTARKRPRQWEIGGR
jgi:hypothetical protein